MSIIINSGVGISMAFPKPLAGRYSCKTLLPTKQHFYLIFLSSPESRANKNNLISLTLTFGQ